MNQSETTCLVTTCLQQTLHPLKVIKAGSAGKNLQTIESDVDLVVAMRNFDHQAIPKYRDIFLKKIIFQTPPHAVEVKRQKWKHGTKLSVFGHSFDILFTGDPQDNRHNNPPEFYHCWYALDQVAYVKEKKVEHPALHETILALKGIRNEKCQDGPRSFFLELLCIQAFDDYVKRTYQPLSIRHALIEVLHMIATTERPPSLEVPFTKQNIWSNMAEWTLLRQVATQELCRLNAEKKTQQFYVCVETSLVEEVKAHGFRARVRDNIAVETSVEKAKQGYSRHHLEQGYVFLIVEGPYLRTFCNEKGSWRIQGKIIPPDHLELIA